MKLTSKRTGETAQVITLAFNPRWDVQVRPDEIVLGMLAFNYHGTVYQLSLTRAEASELGKRLQGAAVK